MRGGLSSENDKNDMLPVSMHWKYRLNHVVGSYNDIYKV